MENKNSFLKKPFNRCLKLASNQITLTVETKKPAYQVSRQSPVNIAVPEACIIGLIAALGAVTLKNGVGVIGTFRVHLASISPHTLPVIGLLGGVLVGFLIQFVDRSIAGSGIPQTKAALFGFPVKLDAKTASVKLLSCVISLGSGLALGREGPTVQVAAGLSSTLSKLRKTSPAHNLQLIAAGAGAGLAAAFNAPLAGVLFVLEELIKKISGFAVGTTVVACFIAAVTSRLVGVHSLDINLSELFPKATFDIYDIPFLVILGMLTGTFGACFNKSIIAALTLNRDIFRFSPIISSGLAGLITGIIVMLLPESFCNYAGLRELILQDHTDLQLIATAFLFQFAAAILAYGSGAPGGLFAPSLTMGACLGHLVAVVQQQLIHHGDIGTMSVVGMGAFFCAVARVPITSVVIVFEMTTDFNLVLPLMICCIVSYLVAEQLDPGSLYDQLVAWSGIKLEEKEEGGVLSSLRAHMIMTRPVKTVPLSADLESVKTIFETSSHRGFPVVDATGKIAGMIAKPDLLSAIQRNLKSQTPVKKIMTAKPITVRPDESLNGVLFLMEKFKVSRLPVIERDKLIGIITRKDIVTAHSQAMGIRSTSSSQSYIIYQTRSAEIGSGRMLVELGDIITAKNLLSISAQIAKHKGYELECLQVITIPQTENPASAHVHSEAAREMARSCESVGSELSIPTHTSVRVAHEVASAISETISDRNIDLLLMRYHGKSSSRQGDQIIQSVLANTNCKVVLVGRNYNADRPLRFIIPIADFINGELAMDTCKNLINSESTVSLCRVIGSKRNGGTRELDERINCISHSWKQQRNHDLEISELEANSPAGILIALKQCKKEDILILGLPKKYLQKSINKGLFRRSLNRINSRSAVILVTE